MSRFVGKKRAKDLTRQVTNNFCQLFLEISDAELRAVIKRASNFSSTNCWWAEYRLQLAIISFAEDELRSRRKAKKMSKEQEAQECDATMPNSSNDAKYIKSDNNGK